jgi:hypothetical protein
MLNTLKTVLGYKSQEQFDSEATDALQKAFRAQSDAKIQLVKDEYELIKDIFLEKITEKITTYEKVINKCIEECKKDFCTKGKQTCDQIGEMISSRSNSEFTNICKNVSHGNQNLRQTCSDANTMQYMIQQLFFMYKLSNKDNLNNDKDYNNIIFQEEYFKRITNPKEHSRLNMQPVLERGGKRRTRRVLKKSKKYKKTNHKKPRK